MIYEKTCRVCGETFITTKRAGDDICSRECVLKVHEVEGDEEHGSYKVPAKKRKEIQMRYVESDFGQTGGAKYTLKHHGGFSHNRDDS